jgi:hypothetical protein
MTNVCLCRDLASCQPLRGHVQGLHQPDVLRLVLKCVQSGEEATREVGQWSLGIVRSTFGDSATPTHKWKCRHCTLHNELAATQCAVCSRRHTDQ